MLIEIMSQWGEQAAFIKSHEIAKAFGVPHETVIQDIESLECAEDLKISLFTLVQIYGSSERFFKITHTGFCLLAMLCPRYQEKRILEETLMQFEIIEKNLRENLIEHTKYKAMTETLNSLTHT